MKTLNKSGGLKCNAMQVLLNQSIAVNKRGNSAHDNNIKPLTTAWADYSHTSSWLNDWMINWLIEWQLVTRQVTKYQNTHSHYWSITQRSAHERLECLVPDLVDMIAVRCFASQLDYQNLWQILQLSETVERIHSAEVDPKIHPKSHKISKYTQCKRKKNQS